MSHRGWAFSYIGTNQNAKAEGAKICINNSYEFDPTSKGFSDGYEQDRKSKEIFYEKLNQLEVSISKLGPNAVNHTQQLNELVEHYGTIF